MRSRGPQGSSYSSGVDITRENSPPGFAWSSSVIGHGLPSRRHYRFLARLQEAPNTTERKVSAESGKHIEFKPFDTCGDADRDDIMKCYLMLLLKPCLKLRLNLFLMFWLRHQKLHKDYGFFFCIIVVPHPDAMEINIQIKNVQKLEDIVNAFAALGQNSGLPLRSGRKEDRLLQQQQRPPRKDRRV